MTVLSAVVRRMCAVCDGGEAPARGLKDDENLLAVRCSHCGWQPKDDYHKLIPPRICPRCA